MGGLKCSFCSASVKYAIKTIEDNYSDIPPKEGVICSRCLTQIVMTEVRLKGEEALAKKKETSTS